MPLCYKYKPYICNQASSSTGPRWRVPPEVLQPEGLLYEPVFGSSRLYRQKPYADNDARDP
jgi:hypothetical protein